MARRCHTTGRRSPRLKDPCERGRKPWTPPKVIQGLRKHFVICGVPPPSFSSRTFGARIKLRVCPPYSVEVPPVVRLVIPFTTLHYVVRGSPDVHRFPTHHLSPSTGLRLSLPTTLRLRPTAQFVLGYCGGARFAIYCRSNTATRAYDPWKHISVHPGRIPFP